MTSSARTPRPPIPAEDLLLSVVIPVYNERVTITEVVSRVRAVPVHMEVVVVDDASVDGTLDVLKGLESDGQIDRLIVHEENRGKGAALRSGFDAVNGNVVIVQDADLEYNPEEYPRLLAPILSGRADVVYGSRFLTSDAHRVLFFWHMVANRVLTLVSNMVTNLNLTDMETCYKVFRTEVVRQLELREPRFGCEPEITARIAKLHCRIYEVGISYDGRGYAEGKKIGWLDALSALRCVLRYGLFARPHLRIEEVYEDLARNPAGESERELERTAV